MNTIDTIGTLGTVGAVVPVVPVVPALPSLGELTEEEVQWLREQDRIRSASASASTVTPVTVVPVPVPALDFKDMQEKATAEDAKRRALEQQQERQLQQDEVLKEIVHKLHCGTAAESLAKTYGSDRVALAEQEQRRTPATTQQSFIKHRSQERANNRELGKALAASGASIQQLSVQDYALVIGTQQDALLRGENPSAKACVDSTFPDNPKKAQSIRLSRRMGRVKEAYKSDAVQQEWLREIGHPDK